jgi:cytochrome P450
MMITWQKLVRLFTSTCFCAGILIPKGWFVIPMFITIHHDPAIYADPATFNPDRFDVSSVIYFKTSFSSQLGLLIKIHQGRLSSNLNHL